MSLSKWIVFGLFTAILAACNTIPPGILQPGISRTEGPARNISSTRSASLEGSADRGGTLFRTAQGAVPACSTCHSTGQEKIVGPGLGGISTEAGKRVRGQSATDYIRTSIVNPGAFLVPGFQNIMPPVYAQRLSDQDIADLIAYLMTLP
jgi:cytochrome c